MSMKNYAYPGEELELFALAQNWKAYWSSVIRPVIHGRVLEVGGGKGENIRYMLNPTVTEWLSIEPDISLCAQLHERIQRDHDDGRVHVHQGTLAEMGGGAEWDAAIYIDVLEHIEDHQAEIEHACAKLKPGGVVVVLSPAHQWLFSKFDSAVGHWRRYNRVMIERLAAPGCRLERVMYLDAVGMLASAANRMMLRQSYPTASQIQLWDRCMVPLSRCLDSVLGYRFGKTIIGVWRKE